MKALVSKEREKQLRLAIKELKIASTRIYQSASGEKPFEISKLLNVMGKITQDYVMILYMLVGDFALDSHKFDWSFDTPPLKLLRAYEENQKPNKT